MSCCSCRDISVREPAARESKSPLSRRTSAASKSYSRINGQSGEPSGRNCSFITAILHCCHSMIGFSRRLLELHVRAKGRHRHRTAVAVIAGIVDVLHARRQVNPAPHMRRVVRLEYGFAPVIQPAIAEQEAQATIGKISLVILADTV